MSHARWRQIRSEFDCLVEVDATDRRQRLEAIGAADPELRKSLESLLVADAEADGRLERIDGVLLRPGNAGANGGDAPITDVLGLSGRIVSHFRVEAPVAAGGMGVVYRAEDIRIGRAVALKFLIPGRELGALASSRILAEARAVGALDHPNLCGVYEVGETEDGRPFLTMPLYPGETLKARLARDGPVPVHESLEIARQIALGLCCAHAAGVIHRDLKPGNLLLTPGGVVKIVDFGLASVGEAGGVAAGPAAGTAAYMAPEQLRTGPIDPRVDLWGLGVVLYEMVTGRRPFQVGPERSIAEAILEDEPPLPSTWSPDLRPEVERLILSLLRKDPAARPPSAEALVSELAAVGTSALEQAHPIPGTGLTGWRRMLPPSLRWGRGGRALLALGGIGVLSGLGVMVHDLGGSPAVAPGTEPLRMDHNRPRDPAARDNVLRARDYLRGGDPRDGAVALALLRRAREQDPAYAPAYGALASAFRDRTRADPERGRMWLDSAVVAARRAIELDPELALAHAELGWSLDQLGQRDAALRAHLRAVQIDPTQSSGLANLYHYGFGRLDEAARWWGPALAADSSNASLQWLAGRTYLHLGMEERAAWHLEKAIELQPGFWWPYYHLSAALVHSGRGEEARAQIRRMVGATDEDPYVMLFAAHALAAMGDLAEARRYADAGLARLPALFRLDPHVFGVARVYQRTGETARADSLISAAGAHLAQRGARGPRRPEDFADLASLQVLQGDDAAAIRSLEEAVRLGWRFQNDEPGEAILSSLRGNRRFDDLMSKAAEEVARQRARVEREGW